MKKIFMFLIMFLLMSCVNVNALEDNFYESEIINEYFIFNNQSSQFKLLKRKGDDSFVYSIRPNYRFDSNISLNGYINNQDNYLKIDSNIWNRIMLISYYGYNYKEHTDIKWYAITQFMIWKEVLNNKDIYFTNILGNDDIIKYEDEINEINNLVNNHEILPSFNNNIYEVKYNTEFTIVDNNNVIKNFNIVGYHDLKITKSNNKLTIKKTKLGKTTLTFLKSSNMYKRKPTIYIDNNEQSLLLPGDLENINAYVYFNLSSSSVNVNIKSLNDINSNFNGTKIQLLDINKNIIDEKIIENNNKVIFDKVIYGDYYLKVVDIIEGYILNNDLTLIKVNESLEEFNLYNKQIENKIIFNKYLSNSIINENLIDKESVFKIYNSDNEEVTTFSNNYFEVILPYGKYLIKQISGREDYLPADDFYIDVSMDNLVQEFNLYNELIVGNIKIINTDYDSNLPILEKGSSFRIKDYYTKSIIFDEIITNDFGIINDISLSYGKYILEQITPVYGYSTNNQEYVFEINKDIKYLEIFVTNLKLKGKLEIENKILYYLNDELVNEIKDNNIDLSLYAYSNIYSKDGIVLYKKDELIGDLDIKDDKLIIEDLVFGSYYFINPGDEKIMLIDMNEDKVKSIKLVNKVYEYKEVVSDTEEKENDLIIEVPNTLSYSSLYFNINNLFILLGLIIMRKNKYENN